MNLVIIGSDNGMPPAQRQAIIWTNADMQSFWPWGINFNGILLEIWNFSFKKLHLKTSPPKWRSYCRSLNVKWHTYESENWVTIGLDKDNGLLHILYPTTVKINYAANNTPT